MSRPDNWRVLVKDLSRRGNLRRDGIYGLLRELRRTGYLCYVPHRAADGRLRGDHYLVTEVPDVVAEAPHPESPDTA